MPTLNEIGLKHGTDKASHHKYCDFYQANLPGPDFNGRLLEIGVKDGASLNMWREYYPKAEIWGIDIALPQHIIKGCRLVQMNQCDVVAMQIHLPYFDIIIDDGSHMTLDQQISFDFLWENKLSHNGLYVMEDVHTSYYIGYVNSQYPTAGHLKNLFPAKFIREWCRVPDKLDSYTMIIAKSHFPNDPIN